mmetsp:Transcript_37732/g.79038  ORF Transcript_37732/g.79038 Transcript_37732/m.79038 type:complete len:354 (-) Transcript_37732:218-1279(-)
MQDSPGKRSIAERAREGISKSRQCQNPHPCLGDEHRVLELRRPPPVSRRDRPVVRPLVAFGAPLRYHGFDGEDHSGEQFHRFVVAKMLDERRTVKVGTDSVASVVPNRIVSVRIRHGVNRTADVAQTPPGPTRRHALVATFQRRTDQPTRRHEPLLLLGRGERRFGRDRNGRPVLHRRTRCIRRSRSVVVPIPRKLILLRIAIQIILHVAHHDRSAIVAVHPPDVTAHVEAHHVPRHQRPRIRYAVTHHLVDAAAHALRKTVVIQRTGIRAHTHGGLVQQRVDFFGGASGPGDGGVAHVIQQSTREAGRARHAFDGRGVVEEDVIGWELGRSHSSGVRVRWEVGGWKVGGGGY